MSVIKKRMSKVQFQGLRDYIQYQGKIWDWQWEWVEGDTFELTLEEISYQNYDWLWGDLEQSE